MNKISRRAILIAAIISCSIFDTGCVIESGLDTPGFAPEKILSCTDDITEYGIGPIRLDDSDGAIAIHCKGFWQTSPGGYGNTYEVQTWNHWIDIECAGDHCCYIGVAGGLIGTGWQGKTERGIRLGASIKEFRNKYPEARFNVLRLGYVVGDRIFKFGPFGLTSIQFGKRDEALF